MTIRNQHTSTSIYLILPSLAFIVDSIVTQILDCSSICVAERSCETSQFTVVRSAFKRNHISIAASTVFSLCPHLLSRKSWELLASEAFK